MSTQDFPGNGQGGGDSEREAEWQQIRDALRGLRYGAVTIIVQDGVVIQIDRTEKRRMRRSTSDSSVRA